MQLYDLEKGGINFLGLFLQQNYNAPIVWNDFIQLIRPVRIIEIGTGTGGMSILLKSINQQSEVFTFDITNHNYITMNRMPHIHFINEDCFKSGTLRELLQSPGLNVLLCDGGNKIEEFNYFSKMIKSGDIIAAHDYSVDKKYWAWSEITIDDIKDSIKENNLTRIRQEDFDTAAWLVFRKQ